MRVLGILAKHWTPLRAKSRLAKSLGGTAAANWHRAALKASLERFSTVADRRILWIDPPEMRKAFEELAEQLPGNWEVQVQVDGDLGDRLAGCFDAAFSAGATQVALLGADTPHLPLSHLQAAWEGLNHTDLVFGPADDGGYFLIGSRITPLPCLKQVPWGDSQVWSITQAMCRQAGVGFDVLPWFYDIDTIAELQRFSAEGHPLEEADLPLQKLRKSAADLLEAVDLAIG